MALRLDATALLLAVCLVNGIVKPLMGWAIHDAPLPNLVSFLCASAGWFTWTRFQNATFRWNRWVGAIALGGLLLPVSFAAWVTAAGVATWILASTMAQPLARAGLIVVVAASLRTPLAEGTMIVLADPILFFDGWLANAIGLAMGGGGGLNGNMILGAEGHAVLVMSGCASFSNVSNALLIWFTVATLWGDRSRLFLAWTAVFLASAIVGINAIRLGGMTISREHYAWIHDGNGASIAEAAMVVAILLAVMWTLWRPNRGVL